MSAERRIMLAMQEQPIVLLPFLFLALLFARAMDRIQAVWSRSTRL